MHELSVLSDFLDLSSTSLSSSSFSFISSTSSRPSTSLRLSSKIPCATSPRRWGLLTTTQVMSPTTISSQRPYVEFNQESVTEKRFPERLFPEDMDYDDAAIGQMLFNAYRRQVDHTEREGLSSGQSSSSMSQDRTGQPVVNSDKSHERGHEIQRQTSENEQIRTLLDRQREQILADCQAVIRRHEFQANYDRRSIQKLSGTIESQQEELHRAQAEELHRRDQQLLHEQLLKQNWDLREAHQRSLTEMEELRKFQSSTFDTIARRRLVEDQDTILELSGRIQELQNEINCMNDSRDFQVAESVRSGHSRVTSQRVSFPPHPIPGGRPSRSIGMPSRREGPPSIWDTHGISGNVLVNPDPSSSAPYPQEFNPWSSSTEEPLHSFTVEKSKRRTQDQDRRCQSGPVSKKFSHPK